MNDGNAPEYMNASPDAWKFDTLVDCCLRNFQWVLADCVGTANHDDDDTVNGNAARPLPLSPCSEPPPPLEGKWYVEYYDSNVTPECKQVSFVHGIMRRFRPGVILC